MLTKILAGSLALAIAAAGFLYWRNGVNAEARAVAESQLKTASDANDKLAKSLVDSNTRHQAELDKRDAKKKEQDAAAKAALLVAQAADRNSVMWRTKFNDLARNPDACWNVVLPDRLFIDGMRDADNH